MKTPKQPKIVRYVKVPTVPNFILGTDGEFKYSIKDFGKEELKVDKWLELFKKFNESYTVDQQNVINFKLWLQEYYFPPKPKKQ